MSSVIATKAAAVMESVRCSPMKSSCGSSSSPTHRNTSTTCSLLEQSVISSAITVKKTALWMFSAMQRRICWAMIDSNSFCTSFEVYFSCCLLRNWWIKGLSSPCRTKSWCRLESVSLPSPRNGRPCRAKNRTEDNTFNRYCLFFCFSAAACLDSISAISTRLAKAAADDLWKLQLSCLANALVPSFQFWKPLTMKLSSVSYFPNHEGFAAGKAVGSILGNIIMQPFPAVKPACLNRPLHRSTFAKLSPWKWKISWLISLIWNSMNTTAAVATTTAVSTARCHWCITCSSLHVVKYYVNCTCLRKPHYCLNECMGFRLT